MTLKIFNLSTIVGMVTGIAIIAISIVLTTEDVGQYMNWPGLAVVLGGTMAATLLAYPMKEVLRVFKIFWVILKNEHIYAEEDQKELVFVARHLMRGQINVIEQELANIRNPFLKTGIQMLIDNTPSQDIAELLEWRIMKTQSREIAEAQIYRTMAMFAPAFGMLGTLIGLVNMLHGMAGSDMEQIGSNMAFALLTTLYGVALANLLFKPIAIKFERRTEQRVQLMTMIMEGVLLVSRGRSPSYIREYLATYFAHIDDELRFNNKELNANVEQKSAKAAADND